MQITKEQLNQWGACSDGVEWFNLNYPDGIADYQEILNRLAEDDHPDYASWLINKAGADADCLIEMDSVDGKKHLFVSGRLIVKNGIEISGHLIAGYDIKAGGGIKAGGSIKAGEGIKAGWGIEVGGVIKSGGGIEAGGGINAVNGIDAVNGINAGGGIKSGNGIKAGWGIDVGRGIDAAGDIRSGKGIKAGGSIKAGEGIKAGWRIEAGDDHGIFAGLRIKISRWKTDACVCAKHRPKNLISGYWKGDTDE